MKTGRLALSRSFILGRRLFREQTLEWNEKNGRHDERWGNQRGCDETATMYV